MNMFACITVPTRALTRIPGLRRFRRQRNAATAASPGEGTVTAESPPLEVHAPSDESGNPAESSDVAMQPPIDQSAGTDRLPASEVDAPRDGGGDAARSLNGRIEVGTEAGVEPITNFALPRELRDEIYAFLLDVERAEKTAEATEFTVPDHREMSFDVGRYEGPRKTYNFTTSIIAVNKTIGAEAQAFFVNHNRFVRLSFNVEGFQRLQFMVDLPIIANIEGKLMGQHCLSIEVGWPETPSIADLILSKYAANFQSKGIVIIALSSLPRLCEIFRFISAIEVPAMPVVASARGEKFSVFAGGTTLDSKPGTLKIEVAVHQPAASTATAISASEQRSILKHLGTIHAGDFNCSISGFDNAAAMVNETKAAMSPSIMFPRAFALDFVDAFRQIKRHTDALATAGHLSSAHYKYTALALWRRECWEFAQQEFEKSLTGRGQLALRRRSTLPLEYLTIDLHFSSLATAIYFKRPWEMFKLLDGLKAKTQTLTSRQHSWLRHLEGLVGLLGFDVSPLNELPATTESLFLFALSNILNALPVKDSWVTRDLRIINEVLGQPPRGTESGVEEWPAFEATLKQILTSADRQGDASVAPRIRDLIPQLSAWTLPFRIYDSTDDPDTPPLAESEDLMGWEDRAHWAELTQEDEVVVQELQKSLGLPLSKFAC